MKILFQSAAALALAAALAGCASTPSSIVAGPTSARPLPLERGSMKCR